MSFLIDKILPIVVYPLGAGILLIIAGLMLLAARRTRASVTVLIVSMLELWAFSTPLVARLMLNSLENTNSEAFASSADVAILLGGMMRGRTSHTYPDLMDTADRAVTAFRLWRAGQVTKILISGGNLPWASDAIPEAQHIAGLLQDWGTPEKAILIEDQSRNTRENAVNSKVLWDRYKFSSGLLVTSATHMPRALAVFQRAGLRVTPVPTDFRGQPYFEGGVLALLPDAGALQDSTAVIKEWVGRLVYRVRGWS